MIKFIRDIIRILTTPSCWIRNYPTDRALSKWINYSLNRGYSPEYLSRYNCSLNGKVLWIANYPYAYGHLDNGHSGMPDRTTVFRLKKALDEVQFVD